MIPLMFSGIVSPIAFISLAPATIPTRPPTIPPPITPAGPKGNPNSAPTSAPVAMNGAAPTAVAPELTAALPKAPSIPVSVVDLV